MKHFEPEYFNLGKDKTELNLVKKKKKHICIKFSHTEINYIFPLGN